MIPYERHAAKTEAHGEEAGKEGDEMKLRLSGFLKRVALYGGLWLGLAFLIRANDPTPTPGSLGYYLGTGLGIVLVVLLMGLLGEGLYQLGRLVSRESGMTDERKDESAKGAAK